MLVNTDLNKIKSNDNKIIKSNIENYELYSDNHPFSLSFRIKNFDSEKDFKYFIKSVERQVRNSIEYRYWKQYLIEVLDINTCIITNEKIEECTIEVHHHIPSLFTLVKILISKRMDNNEEFSTFDIALDTIKLHYLNKLGYITLIKSLHEKFHNGFLSIPISYVKGDYISFLNEYKKYIDDVDRELIDVRLATIESNCTWGRNDYPGMIQNGK